MAFFRSQEETRTEKSSSSSRDEDSQLGQENGPISGQASSSDGSGTSAISQNEQSAPREETTQSGFGEESSGSRTWEGTHERGEEPVVG